MNARLAMMAAAQEKRRTMARLAVFGAAPYDGLYRAVAALRIALYEGWRDYSAPVRNGAGNRRMRRHERERIFHFTA